MPHVCQKKPESVSEETRKCVKRDTQMCPKIFTCVSNETHEYVQRDPQNQKRDPQIWKETYKERPAQCPPYLGMEAGTPTHKHFKRDTQICPKRTTKIEAGGFGRRWKSF